MIYPKITVDDMAMYAADMYKVEPKDNIPQEDQAFARVCYDFARNLPRQVSKKTVLNQGYSESLKDEKDRVQRFLDAKIKEFCDRYIAPIIRGERRVSIPEDAIDFCVFPKSFITHCLNVNGLQLKTDKSVSKVEDSYYYGSGRGDLQIESNKLSKTDRSFDYDRVKKNILGYDKYIIGYSGNEHFDRSFAGSGVISELFGKTRYEFLLESARQIDREIHELCLTIKKMDGCEEIAKIRQDLLDKKNNWTTLKDSDSLTYTDIKIISFKLREMREYVNNINFRLSPEQKFSKIDECIKRCDQVVDVELDGVYDLSVKIGLGDKVHELGMQWEKLKRQIRLSDDAYLKQAETIERIENFENTVIREIEIIKKSQGLDSVKKETQPQQKEDKNSIKTKTQQPQGEYFIDTDDFANSSVELFESVRKYVGSVGKKDNLKKVEQLVSEVNLIIGQCNHTVKYLGNYLKSKTLKSYFVKRIDNQNPESSKEVIPENNRSEEILNDLLSKLAELKKHYGGSNLTNFPALKFIDEQLKKVEGLIEELKLQAQKSGQAAESENTEKQTIQNETVVSEPTKVEKAEEDVFKNNEPVKKQKEETLRQKFDIDNEEDFDKMLAYYAQANRNYYSGDGKKKSEEEIRKRKNVNAQFKRILNKKASTMPQNENGEEFSSTIKSIESGNVFSYAELKQVAQNKQATLTLFGIMASGVYEKDGQKIRLSQKQRIALASTLEIVSGMRLDMDKTINKSTAENKTEIANENQNGSQLEG